MNLSFLRFFKKDKGDEGGVVAVASRPIVGIEKPASERLGKTVMPNTSRIIGGEPMRHFPTAAQVVSAPVGPIPPPALSGKISLGTNGTINARKITIPTAKEAPAKATGERTIALPLGDLVPQIPEGFLAPAKLDPEHCVVFKASVLERGMASGNPKVLLRALYQQAPQFFEAEVGADDQTEVPLPFAKVLEQFASFQVRPDQVEEELIPEVETPFLKVTLEDGKRFGTSAPSAAPEAAPAPEAEIAPAPEAAPAPVVEKKIIKPIRLPMPPASNPVAAAPVAPAPAETPAPRAPVVAKISPNGTGVPATERVPASSGPPVPTPLPSPFAPAQARIPFKVAPPSNDLRAQDAAPSPAPVTEPKPVAFSAAGPRVHLSLARIVRDIPPFQMSGPSDEVPESALLELPFAILQPQLALGRISISPAQFLSALPEQYRDKFKFEDTTSPVSLPLQEVLQNLPGESLQLRGDQVVVEVAEMFETPFSQKAAEDAERLKTPAAPVGNVAAPAPLAVAAEAPPVRISLPKVTEAEAPEAPAPVVAPPPPAVAAPIAEAKPAGRNPLQALLETDDTLDPKTFVAHASRLPGVKACAVVFSDGLSLAENIPSEYEAEGLCAMAPVLMKRICDQMDEANLGSLNGITLFGEKALVSFFAHGNLCLAILHAGAELTSETRLRLNTAVQEMARLYAPSLKSA